MGAVGPADLRPSTEHQKLLATSCQLHVDIVPTIAGIAAMRARPHHQRLPTKRVHAKFVPAPGALL
eukprot:4487747-Alexandrium_andersonii.AAC.1